MNTIGFIQQYQIGQGQLQPNFRLPIQQIFHIFGIGNADHAINPKPLLYRISGDKSIDNARRIGNACSFDQQMIEFVRTAQQRFESMQEVFAQGTANAAIIQLKNGIRCRCNQSAIDAGFTKFVFDDGKFLLRMFANQFIQQTGFPAPKKPVIMVTGIRSCSIGVYD